MSKTVKQSPTPTLTGESIIATLVQHTNNIPLVTYLKVADEEVFIDALTIVVNKRMADMRLRRRDLRARSGLAYSTIMRVCQGESLQGKNKPAYKYYGTLRTYFHVANALGMTLQELITQTHELTNMLSRAGIRASARALNAPQPRIKGLDALHMRPPADLAPPLGVLERVRSLVVSVFKGK